MSWTPEGAEGSGYTNDELAILYEVAARHKVPAEAILKMIREETAYHEMGRRRGLFPALHQIINDVAEGSS
jgi:methyl coenzyme M reductase beta subunit